MTKITPSTIPGKFKIHGLEKVGGFKEYKRWSPKMRTRSGRLEGSRIYAYSALAAKRLRLAIL